MSADSKTLRSPILTALILSVLPLVLAVTAWIKITSNAEALRSIRMTNAVNELRTTLTEKMAGYATVLHGLEGFHAGSEAITAEEWKRYVSSLNLASKHPEIRFVTLSVTTKNDAGVEKSSIFVEPANTVLGQTDPGSDPSIAAAIERMVRSNEIIMERAPDHMRKFEATHVMMIPLHAKNVSATPGMIMMGIDHRPMLHELLADDATHAGFIAEVFDESDVAPDRPLYDKDSEFFGAISRQERIRLAGDTWTLRLSAGKATPESVVERRFALFVLAVGASASIVLFSAAVSMTGSRRRAEILAEAMTKKWRKNAQELKLFQKAVESSTTAIAFCQKTGALTWVNPAWKTLHDCSSESACRTDLFSMLSTDSDSAATVALKKHLLTSKIFSSEDIVMNRGDGSRYSARLTAYPMASGDRRHLFVCVVEDISKQKRIDRAKTEFMSLASHQLRTPLTSMRWILEELKNEPGKMNADQRELTDDAYTCALLMSETIRTMLMLSKIETNNLALNLEEVDLKKLLEGVCNDLEPSFALKNIAVKIVGKGVFAVTDANILYQILANLLDNAAKYSREKGSVVASVTASGKSIRFSVADDGPGIPPHEKKNMFTKFFRGESAAAKSTHGTGLGLYLVKSLVTLLGGTIRFESAVGKGTTFIVSLPLTPPSHGKNHSRG